MKRLLQVIVVASAALSATPAAAALGVAAKVGTLGAGAEVTVGVVETVNVRAGLNALTVDLGDVGGDEGDINAKIELLTLAGLVDWHPGRTGFRLTGGVMLNRNEVGLTADTGEAVSINDRDYLLSDLDGKVAFADLAPYLGIGYGNAAGAGGRWGFALDIGVMFQGSPDVTLEARVDDPTLQPQLDADLEAEAQDIEDDVEGLKYYPVVSLGVSYRF